MARTSAWAPAGAQAKAARAISGRSGQSVAHRRHLGPVDAERGEHGCGGDQLVAGAVDGVADARSATRRRTAAESRPVITTGVMPPRASSLRPWPSSVLKALKASPCSPM